MSLRTEDNREQSYVLEGDRRQTNERIIQKALEQLNDQSVRLLDEDEDEEESDQNLRFKTEDSGEVYEISEVKLLDDQEVPQYKRDNFTLVINENVTENACRVRYSGTPGKR